MQNLLNANKLATLKGKAATITTRATLPDSEGKTLRMDHTGIFEGVVRVNADCTELYTVSDSDTATAERFAMLRNPLTGKAQQIPLTGIFRARHGI